MKRAQNRGLSPVRQDVAPCEPTPGQRPPPARFVCVRMWTNGEPTGDELAERDRCYGPGQAEPGSSLRTWLRV